MRATVNSAPEARRTRSPGRTSGIAVGLPSDMRGVCRVGAGPTSHPARRADHPTGAGARAATMRAPASAWGSGVDIDGEALVPTIRSRGTMTALPCPRCGTPVLTATTSCPQCGVRFAPTRPAWPPPSLQGEAPFPAAPEPPAGWTMPPGPLTDTESWPVSVAVDVGGAQPPLPPKGSPPPWPGPTRPRPLVPYTNARNVRVLCGWLEGIAWFGAAMLVAAMYFALQARTAVVTFFNAPDNTLDRFRLFDGIVHAEDRSDNFLLIGLITWLVVIVLVMILGYRVFKHARSMGAQLRLAPGWAIGGWFVPFVNTVVPFLVVCDAYRVVVSGASPPVGRAYAVERPSGWIWAWWIAVLLGVVSTFFLNNDPHAITSRSDWLAVYTGQAVFAGLLAIAALCLTRWVSQIRRFAAASVMHPLFAGTRT